MKEGRRLEYPEETPDDKPQKKIPSLCFPVSVAIRCLSIGENTKRGSLTYHSDFNHIAFGGSVLFTTTRKVHFRDGARTGSQGLVCLAAVYCDRFRKQV